MLLDMLKIKASITLVFAVLVAACGAAKPPVTNGDSSTCKKIEYCMIGYHNPPGNECACVPN
jgi:hypothetical protein